MPTRTRPTLDATPLYVLAGAGDVAVEKLRELPGALQRLPKDLQRLPKELQSEAQQRAAGIRGQVGQIGDRTNDRYAELAQRGRHLVGQIRRQPSTRRAVQQARSAVAKTRAARTSSGRAVQEATEAAGDATAKIG
jgi:hypothetical protein